MDELLIECERMNKKYGVNFAMRVIEFDFEQIQDVSTIKVAMNKIKKAKDYFDSHESQFITDDKDREIINEKNYIIVCEDTGLSFTRDNQDSVKFPYNALLQMCNGDYHRTNKELVRQYGKRDAYFTTSYGTYNSKTDLFTVSSHGQEFTVAENYAEDGSGFGFDYMIIPKSANGVFADKTLAQINEKSNLFPKPRLILLRQILTELMQ
ncbi:hypothetical protein BMW23_0577 [Bodo saltans virus]|uniref:Uncharacterized protein n=1 Tax=Bodo saltans virus TaxID=2024608 RepID=A0A2H4UUS9_9VIRU|nr:hypothetical protein QJ851_gp0561 [Bodo saltans virus]ATZ80624.1 hypothetical protein BMW23_0577 [Bodo saltans virus]